MQQRDQGFVPEFAHCSNIAQRSQVQVRQNQDGHIFWEAPTQVLLAQFLKAAQARPLQFAVCCYVRQVVLPRI